ncbi:MAG: hypothetical protein RL033_2578 [Pseudomonadota bacterium]|jgi:hypothetical protein
MMFSQSLRRRRPRLGIDPVARVQSALPLLPGLLLFVGLGCSDEATTPGGEAGDGVVDVGGPGGAGDGGDGGSSGNGNGSGGGQQGAGVPLLRAPVATADEALARQALQLMGSPAVGGTGVCKNCHSIGRPTLTRWSQLTKDFSDACLGSAGLANQTAVDGMLDCFKAESGAQYNAAAFGIYAAAAHLPWFTYVFDHASELVDGQREQDNFIARAGMPRSGQPWTQAEFDVVAEWFARGAPKLLDLVPADQGEDCTPGLAPALAAHVQAMASTGWRARNEQASLLNFGCPTGQSGSACLGNFPSASADAQTSAWQPLLGSQIRVLYDNTESPSTYWSRTSADGRYIASGLRNFDDSNEAGQIIDLQLGEVIPGNFLYDATFFPDNSGFVVQQGGGEEEGGSDTEPSDGSVSAGETALTCDQSVLSGDITALTGDEPECQQITGKLGLYQQVATGLNGEDYWVVHGSYTSDNGGFDRVLNNPSADYGASSTVTLTPLINLGNGFDADAAVSVAVPRQGDPMLSASGQLLITRIKGKELSLEDNVIAAEQAGYALYKVETTRNGGSWQASLSDLGRICMQGGKPNFSFDERWLAFHHYVVDADAVELGFSGPNDAGFREYQRQGSSNLYLMDLSSGQVRRVTNFPPGDFALFPHFRSDGWIYFVVRTLEGEEYFSASDAAIVLEGN